LPDIKHAYLAGQQNVVAARARNVKHSELRFRALLTGGDEKLIELARV
jgi:hypothetical protein